MISSNLIQSQSFDNGESMVSIGYGFGSYRLLVSADMAKSATATSQQFQRILLGPVYMKYEYMTDENVSVGINIAAISYHSSSRFQTNYNGIDTSFSNTYNFNSYSILARVNYHNSPDESFDTYAGISVGYRYASTRLAEGSKGTNEVTKNQVPIGIEAVIGARILITENFGIYGELGIAKSILQFGASYKF